MTRKLRIQKCLQDYFSPDHLEILDETHKHAPRDTLETHITITMVTSRFLGMSILSRHRLLNELLRDELHSGLHALSLHLYTPDEWQERGVKSPESPPCKGGHS